MPRYYKSCSTCGAQFARRFNAERHIRSVHAGNGHVGTMNKPINRVRVGNNNFLSADQTHSRGSTVGSLPSNHYYPDRNNHSNGNISQIIDNRCRDIVRERIDAYWNRRKANPLETWPFGFAGYVCNTCLNIDIIEVYSNFSERKHVCTELTTLDYPQIHSNSRIVLDYLHSRLPIYMTEFVKRLWQFRRVTLLARPLRILPDLLVPIDGNPDEHWSIRCIGDKRMTVFDNDAELMEFFRLTQNRTFGFFSVTIERVVRAFIFQLDLN